ncbi:MAG TPA: adenylate/guanylate cyclase domain-containing protein [Rectinemataceae bacterium]|nr:adenylate/guanylate cyclase domain-containing protein [Rectinemataceae bacterium]
MTGQGMSSLTFLFTDIEASARKWEQDAPAMSKALRRHDELLRSAIETHQGRVFKTVGDAFCAAFADPLRALLASIDIQRALDNESWEIHDGIKVRICLHAGLAEERDGDFFGQTLNRAARILSLVHGGQIVASQAATSLVEDHLPEGCSLLPLGAHRLKDLSRPEILAAVTAPGLRSDFPALQSLDARPNNLPQQATSFFDRESEREAVREAFAGGCRLLTIVGPGGEGKTRLAIQIAAELLADFQGGAWFVDLTSCNSEAETANTISLMLGAKNRSDLDLVAGLVANLDGRDILLILDNLEQDLAAAALIGRLVAETRKVRILATSREPLRLSWERVLFLAPLALPPAEGMAPPETLGQYAAVALFIDRALIANPAFRVTNRNAPALAELCARLDGIPLAIELAAARIGSIALEDILARLGSDYSLIDSRAPDRQLRHRTLESVVLWSYELLTDVERRAFRALGAFSGSFDLGAAEAVLEPLGLGPEAAADLLASLVEKSMVVHEGESGRYRLYRILRRFARHAAAETGEAASCFAAHDGYCLSIASAILDGGLPQSSELERLRFLDAVYRDLVAALDGYLRIGDANASLLIAAGLAEYWNLRGAFREGCDRLGAALAAAGDAVNPGLRSKALGGLAQLQRSLGAVDAALDSLAQARRLCAETADGAALAETEVAEGQVLIFLERLEEAEADFRRVLASEQAGASSRAQALYGLGAAARIGGRPEEAATLLGQAIVAFESLGETRWATRAGIDLGILHYDRGDKAAARRAFESCLAGFERLGDRTGLCAVMNNLAEMAFDEERYAEALSGFAGLETQARANGSLRYIALGLSGSARALAMLDRGAEALLRAESARALVPADRFPIEARDALVALALARNALGDCEAAIAALKEAEAMPSADASDHRRIEALRKRLEGCSPSHDRPGAARAASAMRK